MAYPESERDVPREKLEQIILKGSPKEIMAVHQQTGNVILDKTGHCDDVSLYALECLLQKFGE